MGLDKTDMPLVLGGGMVPFSTRRDGSNFRDWVVAAAADAFVDAALAPSDVDSVVIASESDFLSLRSTRRASW